MANDGFEENVNPQDLAFDPYEGLDGDGDGGGQPQFESPARDDGGWENRPMYMSEEQYNRQMYSQPAQQPQQQMQPQQPQPQPQQSQQQMQPQQQPQATGDPDVDVLHTMLRASGVDPDSLKFLTKDGKVVSRRWDELSPEERMSVAGDAVGRLNGLSGDERALIDDMRGRRMGVGQYLDEVRRSGAEDAQARNDYEVDGYDDDQLFIMDAFAKYGLDNVSDAQVEKMLADAKSDPDLWAKTMGAMRAEYKAREEQIDAEEAAEERMREQADYESYSEDIAREIAGIRSIGGLPVELTDADRNDLMNFMTARDGAGNTEFSKALDDPRTQVRAAMWTLMEKRIFDGLTAGFQQAYAQGLGRGQSQAQAQRRRSEVVRQPQGGGYGGGGQRGQGARAPKDARTLDIG